MAPTCCPSLRRESKFLEASEKYRRAKDNLAGDSTTAGVCVAPAQVSGGPPAVRTTPSSDAPPAGKELRKNCMLNLSHCLLKLGQPDAAEAEAAAVLALDGRALKGYYRRGLARQAKGAHRDAVADLKRAASLAPGDEGVAKALSEAKAAALAAGIAVDDTPEALPPPVEEHIVTPGAAAAARNGPVMNEAAMAQMRQAMRSNPELMKTMADVSAGGPKLVCHLCVGLFRRAARD